MLIENLLLLENYFGREASVQNLDTLIATYGLEPVMQEVKNHTLEIKTLPCKIYACLTDIARQS